MIRQATLYTAFALAAAILVALAGTALSPERDAIVAGAAIGGVVQVAVFWIFFVWLFPGRAWHGYGLGVLVRLAAFAVAAFVLVPAAGLPLGATLFSLVGVFWLTTILEPLFLKPRTRNTTQG